MGLNHLDNNNKRKRSVFLLPSLSAVCMFHFLFIHSGNERKIVSAKTKNVMVEYGVVLM